MEDGNLLIFELVCDVLGEPAHHYDTKCQANWDCPVCSASKNMEDEGDGKHNLEVNYELGVYKCWACPDDARTHGTLYKLIKQYGNPKHLKMYELLRPAEKEVVKTVKAFEGLPPEFMLLETATRILPQVRAAYDYLNKRGLEDAIIHRYGLGVCIFGKYDGCIIVPSYGADGSCNYFVGRRYVPGRVKYKNPEADKYQIVFNEYLIDWSKPVWLVEGPFDHLVVDNSIPLLGKYLSEKLWNLLYEKAVTVVVALDPDAKDRQLNLYKQLNTGRLRGLVHYCDNDTASDFSDLNRDHGRQWLDEFRCRCLQQYSDFELSHAA